MQTLERVPIRKLYPLRTAKITDVGDVSLAMKGPIARIGEVWKLERDYGPDEEPIFGEVTHTNDKGFTISLYAKPDGIAPGETMSFQSPWPRQKVGYSMLGRVFDGMGEPYDGGPRLQEYDSVSLKLNRRNPMKREIIDEVLPTGVRAIDGFITMGKGQKIGLFAGSGVGKSVLMGMITRGTTADIRVVAMIGERGREVREFIEHSLGDAMQKSIVFVSPSDSPPLMKLSGLLRAIAVARYFSSHGKDVLLLADSLTRIATALRDLGLAGGEPPVARGFTPAMYNYFPYILEQAGKFENGSLTMISTVLVEEEEEGNPVALTARSILDGHIQLSHDLASKAHYPAIDILRSKSRVMTSVANDDHLKAARTCLKTLSVHREYADIVHMGLYREGSNPALDAAMAIYPKLESIIQQDMDDITSYDSTSNALVKVANEIRQFEEGNQGR